VDLDELGVGVPDALLVAAAGGAARAERTHGGLAIDCAITAGAHGNGVRQERLGLHGAQVGHHDAPAVALAVEDHALEAVVLELAHLALAFPLAHLLIQGVDQLLPGGSPGKRRAVEQRAPEAPEVK